MTTIHSPNNIGVLLWFHTRSVPHERREAPAVREAIDEFLRMGVIEVERCLSGDRYNGTFTTTPLGKAWVQALCNVPPPKSVFVDEQGRVLE